jgi:hypothetical protein
MFVKKMNKIVRRTPVRHIVPTSVYPINNFVLRVLHRKKRQYHVANMAPRTRRRTLTLAGRKLGRPATELVTTFYSSTTENISGIYACLVLQINLMVTVNIN